MAKVLTHQPFPFYHYDIELQQFLPCGITTGRYVQGTPKEMMALFWKIKTFSISGSFTSYLFGNLNQPISSSFSGNCVSLAETEKSLVCNPGYNITTSGSGRIAYVSVLFNFMGSDFYFNSPINQSIVKLYGEFDIYISSPDTSDINISTDGLLAPFLIDGFQVYESGVPVYYNALGLIDNFSASISSTDFWQYS